MGGQKTLRSYWQNYFEKTDTLIWVVDATDRLRVDDCKDELAGLLLEEVNCITLDTAMDGSLLQRLMGASLLVFLNKTDIPGGMTIDQVQEVRIMTDSGRTVANTDSFQALGIDRIKTHRWRIEACSAITGANIQKGLGWVIADAKERMFLY